jgi:hypothetical protein
MRYRSSFKIFVEPNTAINGTWRWSVVLRGLPIRRSERPCMSREQAMSDAERAREEILACW